MCLLSLWLQYLPRMPVECKQSQNSVKGWHSGSSQLFPASFITHPHCPHPHLRKVCSSTSHHPEACKAFPPSLPDKLHSSIKALSPLVVYPCFMQPLSAHLCASLYPSTVCSRLVGIFMDSDSVMRGCHSGDDTIRSCSPEEATSAGPGRSEFGVQVVGEGGGSV